MTLLSMALAAALGATAHPSPKVVLVKHADFIRADYPGQGVLHSHRHDRQGRPGHDPEGERLHPR